LHRGVLRSAGARAVAASKRADGRGRSLGSTLGPRRSHGQTTEDGGVRDLRQVVHDRDALETPFGVRVAPADVQEEAKGDREQPTSCVYSTLPTLFYREIRAEFLTVSGTESNIFF